MGLSAVMACGFETLDTTAEGDSCSLGGYYDSVMAAIVGIVLILVGLACWIRAYIVLTTSNDPADLRSRGDSSASKVARNAAIAAYCVIGLIGLGFGVSLL